MEPKTAPHDSALEDCELVLEPLAANPWERLFLVWQDLNDDVELPVIQW
jgi:hypothetical protein